MNDPLNYLWPLLEARNPVVGAHVVAGWPAEALEALVHRGWLVRAEDAQHVVCPECHEHVEEIIAQDGPGGSVRLFVPCPKVLRASVSPHDRQQWRVNLDSLVASLAATLGLTGSPRELRPQQLWRLGRTTWQGVRHDVLFARGLCWEDAAPVRCAIARTQRPIVFVPDRLPGGDIGTGHAPPVLALSQVATLRDQGLEVARLEIVAALQDGGAPRAGQVAVISEGQLKLMIRQQVKAEQKTSLTDDIYLQAYRQCGSVRAAAGFLSQQTGQMITKDQVYRAVQRAGGAAAVLNAESSDSIQRPVASHRRDKLGKRIIEAKPFESA